MTPEEFRAKARAWAAQAPYRDAFPTTGEEYEEAYRVFICALFEAGLSGVAAPTEYDGQGLDASYRTILEEELRAAGFPPAALRSQSMLLPTILQCASHTVKLRHVPRLLRGQERWAQLLSEPAGGSDLAGVTTRARRDGDTFVIDGQKVWSSSAAHAHFGMCLARTNPDVEKHAGLTMIIVPLKAEGVTIRPLTMITGESDFCEVFLDGVVVDADSVIGEVDGGWTVARIQLSHERSNAGAREYRDPLALTRVALDDGGAPATPSVAELAAAETYARTAAIADLVRRVGERRTAGIENEFASAMVKLARAGHSQANSVIGLQTRGLAGVVWPVGDAAAGTFADHYLSSRAESIGGGTSEMQRNIVAERLLGMPRERREDVGKAFRDIRTNEFT